MADIALTMRNLNLDRLIDLSVDFPVQNTLTDIYSQEEFHSILVREKARADRTGQGFSVVTIEVFSLHAVTSFVNHLQQRFRASDDIGWFDGNKLGVFLFNTAALGASQFVNKCRENMGDGFSSFKCSIYSYPNEWCDF
jgi:hypothetical protein